MNTIPSCMDRYMNRYMVQQPPSQPPQIHQQSSHPPSNQGYYHQGPQCGVQNGPHPNNYMIGCFQNSAANGWTGVPLISTATRRPRKQQNNLNNNNTTCNTTPNQISTNRGRNEFDENTISRLAIHAHGAPLIVTGRYRNNNKPHNSNTNNNNCNKREQPSKSTYIYVKDDTQKSTQVINHSQELSSIPTSITTPTTKPSTIISSHAQQTTIGALTNNENACLSSNGNIQETCLPRIIKPRKRRKKDRKPNVSQIDLKTTSSNSSSSSSSISSSISPHDETGFKSEAIIDQENSIKNNSDGEKLDTEIMSSCSCRLCDPYCRIWAFPLRRSCSDNSAEIDNSGKTTTKNVGVIGSNRISTVRNEWRSSPQLIDISNDYNGSRKGSFSDSGDSGCDLLSGLNISDELLLTTRASFRSGSSLSSTSSSGPTTTSLSSYSSGGGSALTSPTNRYNNNSVINNNNSFVNFPSSDSEYILNKNINDISKKMIESLDFKNDINCSGLSSSDESVFSDSCGLDYNHHKNHHNNSMFTEHSNTGFTTMSNMGLNNNNNNICLSINYNNILDSSNNKGYISNNLFNETFTLLHETDKGSEIFNCLDMVWDGSKILMDN